MEKQSKIVSNAVLKKVSEDSIDDNNVDNSNYYYLEKEKEEEEKFHEYIQTNIEKILSINFDKIFYNNQSNSMIEQVKKLYKNVYEKENENIANIDKINLNTKNNELIYTIKEDLDEDKEEPESKNISMKNNSLKNTSSRSSFTSKGLVITHEHKTLTSFLFCTLTSDSRCSKRSKAVRLS